RMVQQPQIPPQLSQPPVPPSQSLLARLLTLRFVIILIGAYTVEIICTSSWINTKSFGDEGDKINLNEIIDHSRVDQNELELRLRYVERRISYLNKKPDVDVGIDGQYSIFIDQCYYEEPKYIYRLCMFKDAKQMSIVGGTAIIIGYWNSWAGPANNKCLKMKYSNGDTCWNGPARSLIVTFECGIENQIVNVQEPNRCQYTITFKTPLVCAKAITEELLDKHEEL
ncbi:unnamed protein product, partial [Rotaria sp. Silwood2]